MRFLKSVPLLFFVLSPVLVAQGSRPASRPLRPVLKSFEARSRKADWGAAAPGRQVVPVKLMPITGAPYSPPDAMRYRVRDSDLVIGLAADGKARAYPILMLGGPKREIINDRLGNEPYAVNW